MLKKNSSRFGKQRHKGTIIASLCIIALIAMLILLGVWQLFRGFEKQATLDAFALAQRMPAKNSDKLNNLNNLDAPPPSFSKIKFRGTYGNQADEVIWVERFITINELDIPENRATDAHQSNQSNQTNQTNQTNQINASNTSNAANTQTSENTNKSTNASTITEQRNKNTHYLLMQKLYLDENPSNIKHIWVWRGYSESLLSEHALNRLPKVVSNHTLQILPFLPKVLQLGDNCKQVRIPEFETTSTISQTNVNTSVMHATALAYTVCQNFQPHGNSKAIPRFIAFDMQPPAPLFAPKNLAALQAHFVSIPPDRHFAYAATWFGLAAIIFAIAIYLARKQRKNASAS